MFSILCFGDSNTYGYMPGGVGRYDADTRFPTVLAGLLGPDWVLTEDGVVGRTTEFEDPARTGKRGLTDVATAARTAEPNLLVLMLGTNDCKMCFGATAEEIADAAAKLAQAAEAAASGVQVLLASPPVIRRSALACGDYNEASLETSRGLAAAYQKQAEKRGWLFWDADRSAHTSDVDGEHLTAEGHAALARDLAGVIRQWRESAIR